MDSLSNKSTSPGNVTASSSPKDHNHSAENEPENFFQDDYDAALIVLSLMIIATNTLVILLFSRKHQLRTKTNTLLLSLAVSDLMMGVVGIPLNIACNALYITPVCISATVIYRFIAISTIFHILAITMERYISVIHPLKYFAIVTRSRVMKVIFVLWMTSLFIALVQLTWTNFDDIGGIDMAQVRCNLIYNVLGTMLCFVLPVLVMSITYYRVFVAIRRQVREIKKLAVSAQKQSTRPLSTELRAVMIFALMLGIFVCFWVSWYVVALHVYITVYFNLHDNLVLPGVWANLFNFLRLSTSLVNPVLYTFLKQDFRRALIPMIPCARKRMARNNVLEMQAIMVRPSTTTTLASRSAQSLGIESQMEQTTLKPLINNR